MANDGFQSCPQEPLAGEAWRWKHCHFFLQNMNNVRCISNVTNKHYWLKSYWLILILESKKLYIFLQNILIICIIFSMWPINVIVWYWLTCSQLILVETLLMLFSRYEFFSSSFLFPNFEIWYQALRSARAATASASPPSKAENKELWSKNSTRTWPRRVRTSRSLPPPPAPPPLILRLTVRCLGRALGLLNAICFR